VSVNQVHRFGSWQTLNLYLSSKNIVNCMDPDAGRSGT
jgi:hypothetical protein